MPKKLDNLLTRVYNVEYEAEKEKRGTGQALGTLCPKESLYDIAGAWGCFPPQPRTSAPGTEGGRIEA